MFVRRDPVAHSLLAIVMVFCLLPASVAAEDSSAAFTTFDRTRGGCFDSPNGVNCNNYRSIQDVYFNGGPLLNTLEDGVYFWVIVEPGAQQRGLTDLASGNLSCSADAPFCDPRSNRSFAVVNGMLLYPGTHAMGTSPMGQPVIQLYPFGCTDNQAGVYILAVCQRISAGRLDCKYDAFHADRNGDFCN